VSRPPSVFIEIGQRFGRLVVTQTGLRVGQTAKRPTGVRAALCLCDCGTEATIAISGLTRTAGVKSCGCIKREAAWTRTPEQKAKIAATARMINARPGAREWAAGLCARQTPEQAARRNANRKPPPVRWRHGLHHHPLYAIWRQMMRRCYAIDRPGYQHWGGRGIRVHEPWHDVRVFIADVEAEIGPRPDGKYPSGYPLYTLDRVDNEGDYRPGNVRWATMAEQCANRRRPHQLLSPP